MSDKTARSVNLPYRACVGMTVFNRDGLVWIGYRSDTDADGEGAGHWWQMPQGGLGKSEDPSAAALRELYEETSIRTVSLIRDAPGWFSYDLPAELVPGSWGGRYRGQTQKWFALRFDGEDSEINVENPGGGKHKPEFSGWRWERLDRITSLVVPFKRAVYRQLAEVFRDIPD